VGAFLAELEFQRYQPRHPLTDLLNQYDLIQVVAGTPAWAFVTRDVHRPVCLFTATTIQKERTSILLHQRSWERLWLRIMTSLNWRIEQKVLARLECVFAESEYTRLSLKNLVSQEKLTLSVPGIDTNIFSPVTYRDNGYILSVARFDDPRKNVRLLFSAYARLCNCMPSAPRLVLAGHKPAEQDWRFAESLGITGQIDLLGPIPPQSPRLAEIYCSASLFVLSSNEEGLGIVILEAMASGLPVISTRCGGPETAVIEGETGYLTPVGDAHALARAMEELLIDPELRRQMGIAGRRVAEERFSITAAGKVFLDCYDALLKS
jgi:glycosyltransferase involved in cell wall biosynthesis